MKEAGPKRILRHILKWRKIIIRLLLERGAKDGIGMGLWGKYLFKSAINFF